MTSPRQSELSRLERLLDQYGADQSRWPEEEVPFALRLIQEDETARALHRSQLEVETVLDAAALLEPSRDLQRRLAELPARAQQSASWSAWFDLQTWLRPGQWMMPVTAALAITLLGGVTGWMTQAAQSEAELVQQTGSEEEDDWEELSELVLAQHLEEDWE